MDKKLVIMPCMDMIAGRVVKGVKFVDIKDAGDPVECCRAYCAAGADELAMLDITATIESRKTLVEVTRKVADVVTVPFTKDELGDALGIVSCAIACITDVRLAQAFVKTLGDPEKNAKLLEDLDVRVKRVEQRRAEEKAHRYNVRHGKK